MKTIFKYPIPTMHGRHITVAMPSGAEIVSVVNHNDELVCWAIVETDRHRDELAMRRIEIVRTGAPLADSGKFIGTVQFGEKDELVLHIFDLGER